MWSSCKRLYRERDLTLGNGGSKRGDGGCHNMVEKIIVSRDEVLYYPWIV